jgi:hypothetical protein
VLSELGFKGGSVSIPGRVLPEAYAVWAGAEPYPHRANLNFRQVKGESGFVEIPVAVSYQRPTARGDRGEQGYEWLYIPSNKYNHRAVVHDLLERFLTDSPSFGTIVTDTHNNMDFSDPEHHATKKLRIILEAIRTDCQQMKLPPVGTTVERLRDLVMSANETD